MSGKRFCVPAVSGVVDHLDLAGRQGSGGFLLRSRTSPSAPRVTGLNDDDRSGNNPPHNLEKEHPRGNNTPYNRLHPGWEATRIGVIVLCPSIEMLDPCDQRETNDPERIHCRIGL